LKRPRFIFDSETAWAIFFCTPVAIVLAVLAVLAVFRIIEWIL
jgi:hypothetical protein